MTGLANGLSGLNLNPSAMSFTPDGNASTMNGGNSFGDYKRVVYELMDRLCMGGPAAVKAAEDIALTVLGERVTSMDSFGFAQELKAAAEDQNAPLAREGAFLAYK